MRWGIGRGEKGRKEVGTEREKEREWERESQYSICWNLFFKVSYFNGYVNFFKPVSTHNLMVRKAGRWRKRTSTSQLHWPLPALPPIYLSGDLDPQKEARAFTERKGRGVNWRAPSKFGGNFSYSGQGYAVISAWMALRSFPHIPFWCQKSPMIFSLWSI